MKKLFGLFLSLITVFALFACGKDPVDPVDPDPDPQKTYYTISYYEGDQKIGSEQVEEGKKGLYTVDGYFVVTDFYTSAQGLADEDKDAKWDKDSAINANVNLYAKYIRNKLVGGDTHTNYASFSLSPSNFNPLTYKSTSDAVPHDYTTNSFYEYAYNEDGTGFTLEPVMAAADPVDVTAQYAALEGDPYGLLDKFEEDEPKVGYAFRIALNPDAKWENGDAITADDYLYTMETLLDGKYNNYRASNYYQGGSAIFGAKDYFYSGKTGVGNARLSFEHYSEEDDADLTFVWDPKSKDTGFLEYFWSTGGADVVGTEKYPTITSILNVLGWGLTTDDAVFASMHGHTLAEIKADATMKAAWDELIGAWKTKDDEELDFFTAEYSMPVFDFDHVGIKKVDDHTLDIVYTSQLLGFYQKYTIGLPLVKESLYEASLSQDAVTGAWSSTYGTSTSTYMSYGPYKFTRYIVDQVMEFARNENWFGYTEKYASKYGTFVREVDGATVHQYETTNVVLNYVPNISTREQMFLSGMLDTFGMNKAYFDTYGQSRRKYNATGASTYYGIVLSDYDSLVEREATLNGKTYSEDYNGANEQYNKTILTIKEFRQALCYALDRRSLITNLYPGGSPAISLFSDLIIADPENGIAFNSFDSTKEAICEFWGVSYGEGEDFATLDEAYNAITGYDMTTAKQLVDVAVDKAIAANLMGQNTIVRIDYCAANDSETEQLWYNTFKDSFDTLFKGTKLEGKFQFDYNTNLGSDFGGAIQSGKADTAWGFGWSGGELDPYDLFQVYVDAPSGADEPYQYDMWIDRSGDDYEITLNLDLGDGEEEYTYNCYEWYQILNGQSDVLPNWRFGKVADSVRAQVLAALEGAVLNDYTTIPMMNQGSVQLLSYKLNYGKEEFMFGMGFGGIRYLTYNFTDGEWADYVAQQGGVLNYK